MPLGRGSSSERQEVQPWLTRVKVIFGRNTRLYVVGQSANTTLPADTVAVPAAWGTPAPQTQPWVDLGSTSGGIRFGLAIQRADIRTDQQFDPIARVATSRTGTIGANLTEITPSNIMTATGQGTLTSLAPTTALPGHDDIDMTDSVVETYYAAGIDVLSPGDNQPFHVLGWKCLPTGAPTVNFQVQTEALLAVEFSLLVDTSTTPGRVLKVRDVSAHL
jgi:hypothetical protein